MGKQTSDATKAAALYMLKNGLASYKEIAELSGRSQQMTRIWAGKLMGREHESDIYNEPGPAPIGRAADRLAHLPAASFIEM